MDLSRKGIYCRGVWASRDEPEQLQVNGNFIHQGLVIFQEEMRKEPARFDEDLKGKEDQEKVE